ncbi:MAG: D-alanyl-D-alanine carboxypeptidase/D-alanyl-D-alanine-endopeptidase [Sedimentisphaerales bacterium]|nr:D-alanyl-D-alanine carboxypeptidase/D-alanyl-D-alanine-endopeptidase [Sedimentisphaerales bacterium]
MFLKRPLVALLVNALLCGPAPADLAERIAGIVGSARPSDYAVQVVEPKSGKVVYSHNAKAALIPASNMKLITTAAALKYLGPLFEYKTSVTLWGNTLVVAGSGDPLLGDRAADARYGREDGWILAAIAQGLEEREIQEINDIVVDTTVFDDERVHPNWPPSDLNRWYACEVCGLNYNANCIQITTDNRAGRIAISVQPQTSFVEIVNEVQAITSGEGAVGAYRNRQPNRITIRGKCKDRQGPFDVAIEKPAAMFGFLLAEHLVRAGIAVRGRLVEGAFDRTGAGVEVVQFTTPLVDCLHRANKDSLGLAAEALLKTMAAENNIDKKNGSWQQGRQLIGQYLCDLGVAAEEFKIDDGSGLSSENRLSAHSLAAVLLDVYRSGNWELYRTSLAVGGEDGTVEHYLKFKEAKYRANILGKTGYITGVRSFSGVCLTDEGPYLFSILSNRSSLSRNAINQIAAAIIDEYGAGD